MNDARHELDIADALATVQEQRLRGDSADVFAWRERLGESHAEFIELVQIDAMIDEVIEPPAPEELPRKFGSFTLLRELGRGAIGVVYEAVHTTLGRKAAVKVLRSGFDRDPESRERFRREAFATAQVRHDHIVEIFEAGEIAGSPFYAMALVEGESLAATIHAKKVPPVRDLCREFAGVADALDALHRTRPAIVHRDVKPGNIMVRPDGRMILADFGLALAHDGLDLTHTGVAIGTPLYMPPEQMLGRREEMDARADVYALGASLYEAIAGRPVFAASSIATVSKQVVSERPVRLSAIARDCPAAVERIVMKALEKRREDRYASAAEMRDELRAAADGREKDVRGAPVSPIRRIARWARTPIGIAAAAGAMLAVGAGFLYAHRDATLALTTLPEGVDVFVAGAPKGRTPLSMPLRPGTYEVVLRTEGFVEWKRTIDLSAGVQRDFEFPMVPKDVNDPVARLRLAKALGLGEFGYEFRRDRSGGMPLVFVHPRGNVRLSDLEQFCYDIDLGAGLPEEGAVLEFRRGDELLHREAFEPKDGRTCTALPAAVRSRVKVGDIVTWGVVSPGRSGPAAAKAKNAQATFTVVEVDVSTEFDRIAKKMKDVPALRAELEIRALWKKGLNSVALLRADALADALPTSLLAQAIARQAHAKLSINDSVRVSELLQRIDAFPEAERDRLKNAVHPLKR